MNFGPKNLLMLGIALLAACGGDAPVPPPAPEPQSPPPTVYSTGLSSIYGGTLTGGNAYDIIVVVDSAKVLWGIYGSDASTEFRPLGLLRGWQPTTSTSTRYVSTDGDMTAPGSWRPTKVDLSFDASIPSMSGSVTADLASFSIGGGRMPGQGYDPNAQPTLDEIVGNWTLVPNSGRPYFDERRRIRRHYGNCGRLFDPRIVDPRWQLGQELLRRDPPVPAGHTADMHGAVCVL